MKLTSPENCLIWEVDRATSFAINNTKCFAPVVIPSAKDNTKLPQQLKSVQYSNAKLTGINVNQKHHYRHRTNI